MLTEFDVQQGSPFSAGLNLVGLGLLIYGLTSEVTLGSHGRSLAALILLVVAVGGWLAFVVTRLRPPTRLFMVPLVILAVSGGALVAFAPLALTFVGVAALVATLRRGLRESLWYAALGPASTLVSAASLGKTLTMATSAAAAALTGAVLGFSRRQAVERTHQSALVEVTAARAEAERARAELLAGRNHLARELHDVLAHTLSALSLQLEALDSTLDGSERADVRMQLEATKRLVREGLDEARGAVRALREDALPIEEQLAKLAGERHVDLRVEGEPRAIAPDVSLALFRVAQEALTNAVKHAAGAATEIRLAFGSSALTLAVENGPGASSERRPELAESGAGLGLQGIRERVLLLGGQVEAGPTDAGWLVHAEVPA